VCRERENRQRRPFSSLLSCWCPGGKETSHHISTTVFFRNHPYKMDGWKRTHHILPFSSWVFSLVSEEDCRDLAFFFHQSVAAPVNVRTGRCAEGLTVPLVLYCVKCDSSPTFDCLVSSRLVLPCPCPCLALALPLPCPCLAFALPLPSPCLALSCLVLSSGL
jgi:hypothetical protein